MKKSFLAAAVILASAVAGAGSAHAADTLAKIRTANKIVIGTRDSSAPLAYTTGDGKYVGYHVEVCQRIADAIKTNLKLANLPIEYQLVTSQNRVPLVQNGTVDMECGSTTNNATRQKDVSFAPTTFVTNVRIAVKANSGINSIADLKNKTVATTTGTTSVQLLRKHERANGVDFKEIFGKDHADSFLLMESGRADAFVMDDNILAGLIVNSKSPNDYRIVGESLSEEPIAIMIPKDDPAYKKLIDDTVMGMMKSGELEKIYNKWFLSPIPPRNATVNMAMSASLKNAIANPNDRPAETYVRK
ncbi:amino acid ABC transporter substrate-binding protein [Piscinibacter koreensis]|uniref:Amino acid ABC transporter substrate-binding protein n=1 Tax=Piscinibacter koreensis TaxID=2742824 RepID=A0A7Y6TX44_9BURK|nr:amino acid ABC transporter substrate-binding protein [Schlegelella koreensis]NUZ06707.1 amino acid ABC transporter substrate-binding protein [Schlegelella koreensis]